MPTDPDVDRQRARLVAAAAQSRAAALGVELPGDLRLWDLAGDRPPAARDGEPGAELATVLEAATPAPTRRVNGLHVTPSWLADHLVELAFEDLDPPGSPVDLTVCDPACGGGAFLLAAAQALHARGADRSHVVRHLLWGADVDPVGLATAEAALALWAGEPPPPGRLAVADALMVGAAAWPDPPAGGFAAVVGNPPFLSQLGRATVRSVEDNRRVRERFGGAVRAYTDAAWLFLLLAVDLARPGGRVALVQPLSLVGARDAAVVRAALDERATLRRLWIEAGRTFAASVHVCAPVLQVAEAGAAPVARASPWADHLAGALGIPAVPATGTATLGDRAAVTAGFRDEYYGLVPLVREAQADDAGSGRPLVTVGLVDWGRVAWGERPTRFAKRRWDAPVVDLDLRDGTDDSPLARNVARWIERVTQPKVVVATQTRVVEAAVDETGRWVPCVPAVAVLPHDPADVWLLAAAVAAPSSTAWLLRRAPGTALSRGALKIAARDLAQLPLPDDDAAWAEAAAALRDHDRDPRPATLDAYTGAAARAYGSPPELIDWWRARLGAAAPSPLASAAGPG